ncbi:MAG: hypothetical protein L0Y56_21235, partial [Nitrospira sp.]|nr:hypothetical protein [Nitrospira sp.]
EEEGVEVVTVVSEVPLSYCGMEIKIDTDEYIGEECAKVTSEEVQVGFVAQEQYGSTMLSLGGINRIKETKSGLTTVLLMEAIANRERVEVQVERGAHIAFRVGEAPVINRKRIEKMRVGCGSAAMALFAYPFREAADEVIVIDSDLTAIYTEHPVGKDLAPEFSGIHLKFRRSSLGRYFGDDGSGWGGTSIQNPLNIISYIERIQHKEGMTVLITEATGERSALFQIQGGKLIEIPLTPQALRAIQLIQGNCEPSRVSALFIGGAGGSARVGVVSKPLKFTEAVHQGKVRMTSGGALVFIYPGGGITYAVDVEKIMKGSFGWIPTPAIVAPIEYTMTLNVYLELGGFVDSIVPLKELRAPVVFYQK